MQPTAAAALRQAACPFLAQTTNTISSDLVPGLVQTFAKVCPFLKSVQGAPDAAASTSAKMGMCVSCLSKPLCCCDRERGCSSRNTLPNRFHGRVDGV